MHETQWYAVSTKPHQEKQAELHITQCGIECFLPLIKESKIIRRVRKTAIGPLFPGYLFARFDLAEHYRAVSFARGVRKIVEFGSRPAEVDVALIDAIRGKLDKGYVEIDPQGLVHGQVVEIQAGALGGIEAVFVRKMSDQQRVMLLIQGLHFRARVIAKMEQISLRPAV